MSLFLPLPTKWEKVFTVDLFLMENFEKPTRYAVKVDRGGVLTDLKLSLGNLCQLEFNEIEFVDFLNNQIFSFLPDERLIKEMDDSVVITAFQVFKNPSLVLSGG
jgi:hypothetical protein